MKKTAPHRSAVWAGMGAELGVHIRWHLKYIVAQTGLQANGEEGERSHAKIKNIYQNERKEKKTSWAGMDRDMRPDQMASHIHRGCHPVVVTRSFSRMRHTRKCLTRSEINPVYFCGDEFYRSRMIKIGATAVALMRVL